MRHRPLRAGLGPLLVTPVTGSILLLRTRGRRSGLVREAPLGYVVHDGSIYVCAGFGRGTAWLANLLGIALVDVTLLALILGCLRRRPGPQVRATFGPRGSRTGPASATPRWTA